MLGNIFHVVNRGAKRQRLFDDSGDYDAFLKILSRSVSRGGVDLFAYCLMPNHWHLVTAAANPSCLSSFMHHLTTTHSRRWCITHGVASEGAVYQGRFTAVAVQDDRHFLWVCRYVERNPLRTDLVRRAEDWLGSSLGHNDGVAPPLATWPVERPAKWRDEVNLPQTPGELQAIRDSLRWRRPLGDEEWRLKLTGATKSRGRPRTGGRNPPLVAGVEK
jgi:putative transposase